MTLSKTFFTSCDKQWKSHEFKNNYYKVWQKLLQSVTGITESGRIYYKVRQLLQSVKGGYCKVWQVLQSVLIMTKWDITISWITLDQYLNQCIFNILLNEQHKLFDVSSTVTKNQRKFIFLNIYCFKNTENINK